jgi:hypothetical protein
MTTVLQETEPQYINQPWLKKLTQYQLVPQLVKELLIDDAIAPITLTESEVQAAIISFCQSQRIDSDEARQNWLKHFHMDAKQFELQAIRQAKLEQFKQERWASQVEPLFLAQKQYFDQVTYSLLRTDSMDIAQELFFRLKDKEQTFAELVPIYSHGVETKTGGLIGPIEVSRIHPGLAKMLMQAQPGKVCPPTKLDQWVVIVCLEQFTPAILDQSLRQRLQDHLFQEWLQKELARFDLSLIASLAMV